MEKYSKFIFNSSIIIAFFASLLSGCSLKSPSQPISSINNSFSNPDSALINHEYSEINYLKIFWSQIFLVDLTDYYVYLYSLTCSHCAQLKNAIIEYALYNVYPIYFVQESSSVVIDEVKASKINVTNIDELGIRGFPTLLSLKNKTVIHQYVGVTPIKNELLI